MTAINPYYTSDGRYITDTSQIDSYGGENSTAPTTPYTPTNVPQGSFDDYRSKIAAGLISPQDAYSQITANYKTPGGAGTPSNVSAESVAAYQKSLADAKTKLFEPLQVNSDYQYHRPGALDQTGDISLQGARVNQSTTGGFGTTTSAGIDNLPTVPQQQPQLTNLSPVTMNPGAQNMLPNKQTALPQPMVLPSNVQSRANNN